MWSELTKQIPSNAKILVPKNNGIDFQSATDTLEDKGGKSIAQ